MKVLVIGASGRVGNSLTEKLLAQDHHVVGTTRKDEKLFEAENYSQIALDLSSSKSDMEKQIPNDVEAIFFVSGSRGEDLLQTDLHGAIKTMEVAEKKNIKRYIMLSTVFATDTDKWEQLPKDMIDYYVSKHYADKWLMKNTSLDYTILQPSALKDEEGTGKIEVDIEKAGENPIEDVADTLVGLLDNYSTSNKVITMQSGSKKIKEALAEV
ncbi:NAD(P)H-binding protein [Bernardetia sp.]|uniref:NAD(P)H-binding protein n=1 Tax=Bernardetia sp. TaxID=1937974 RepID=UPI0025C5B6C8|nr:NAD(P)H-binding protein [Bernardetia sp.]